ncbi:MAG: ABC transporter permease [Terriglobales bacterium]
MGALLRDLRYACRQMAAAPALAVIVVLSLALGIGANTAVFSLTNAVLLRDLPVAQPGRLVLLRWGGGDHSFNSTNDLPEGYVFSYPAFQRLRARAADLSSLFAFVPLGGTENTTVVVNGHPGLADGSMVTGQFFSGLGVRPLLGRGLLPRDESLGAPPVAVISYGYWTRRFSRDPAILGRSVLINGMAYHVVGVMPPSFHGLRPARRFDLWVPMLERPGLGPLGYPDGDFLAAKNRIWLEVMGRLRPGATRAQAQAQLTTIFQQFLTEISTPKPKPGTLPKIEALSGIHGMNGVVQMTAQPLLLMIVLVGLILLVACANAAALLLARAASRRREISVRLALGASRGRLLRQLLTESVLLAVCGAVIGLGFALLGLRAMAAEVNTMGLGIAIHPQLDLRVLLFTAAVAFITGLLFGILPALRATRVELAGALQERGATAGSARLGAGRALLIAQVAISVLLVASAGLFVRTLHNLQAEDLGFPDSHVLLFTVDPTQTGYHGARLMQIYAALQLRLSHLPGVRAATLTEATPLSGSGNGGPARAEGVAHQPTERDVRWDIVGPDYLNTMGIPLLMGRDFGPQDTGTSPKVAIVNEKMARRFFGTADVLGRHFHLTGVDWEIAGVMRNATYGTPGTPMQAQAVVPYTQFQELVTGMNVALRTYGNPASVLAEVRAAVHSLDPGLPLGDVRTERQEAAAGIAGQRILAWLAGLLGFISLVLAAIGLEGSMAYLVARRTGEIGIRMALGAQRGAVLAMILRQALWMVLIGIAIGVPLTLGVSRYTAALLYGVQARDPRSLAIAVALLAGVGALAAYLPARRAAQVDPLTALRYE